MIERITDS